MTKKTRLIRRCSNYNPVLANTGKSSVLFGQTEKVLHELQEFVTRHLRDEELPRLPGKEYYSQIPLPARISHVIAKTGSGQIRAITAKIKKARAGGDNKKKYQEEILQAWDSGLEINIGKVNIELDARFIDIQDSRTDFCDYWVKITSFPNKSFLFPVKKTRHMRELEYQGFQLKRNALRVNQDGTITFHYIKDLKHKYGINSLGVDLGRNKLVTCSDGTTETSHQLGRKIHELLEKISKKKHGSKASAQVRQEIKNQINYCLKNDIPWDQIEVLICEKLDGMKTGNKWGRRNQYWTVGYTQRKIEELCEKNGVRLLRVNPAYTSQECSECGHRHKNNRNAEKFLCLRCGHEMDADLNAAINIRTRGANSPSFQKILKEYRFYGPV